MAHWRHGFKFDNSSSSLKQLCVSLQEQYFRNYEDSLDEGKTKLISPALIPSSVKGVLGVMLFPHHRGLDGNVTAGGTAVFVGISFPTNK